MKRKHYSEEKIISILKEHEAGASAKDLSRRHGVAENTVYRWKAKFGGMEVSDAKRLRELEAENLRLKRLLAEDRCHILVLSHIPESGPASWRYQRLAIDGIPEPLVIVDRVGRGMASRVGFGMGAINQKHAESLLPQAEAALTGGQLLPEEQAPVDETQSEGTAA